jgi:hypothetical protein
LSRLNANEPAGPLMTIDVKSTSCVPLTTAVTLALLTEGVITVKVAVSTNDPATGVLPKLALPEERSIGPRLALKAPADPIARRRAVATGCFFMLLFQPTKEMSQCTGETSSRSPLNEGSNRTQPGVVGVCEFAHFAEGWPT